MRKYYELSSAQHILFFTQTFTIHKQINNICTSVLVDQELDLSILKKAIELAYERNDSFQIRLTKKDKVVKQYFTEFEKPNIEYLDFRGMTLDQMEKKLYQIAKKRITRLDKPLNKIYMMHSYSGKCGIFFGVSHLVMDSWAITTFFKDILSIYQALYEGSELPKPLVPCQELLMKDLNYKNTEAYKRDRKYWETYNEAPEPIYNHINGYRVLEENRRKKKNPNLRYGNGFSLRTKAKNTMLPFSKELVQGMEEYCNINRVSMQSLIILAYRSFLSKVNRRQKDVSFMTVIARRGTLKEKNSGGTRVHFMPFRTIIEEDTSFGEACERISEQQTSTYRHVGINPLEVIDIIHEKYKTPRMGTHYFSSLTFQPVKLNNGHNMNVETKWYGNGAAAQALYLTIMDGDGAGGLKFYYEYQTAVVTFERIIKLHSYMKFFIEKGIENKKITIGELLDLEVEEIHTAMELN